MDILRRISKGRRWAFSLGQLMALLDVVEEQTVPLEIRLGEGGGGLCLGDAVVRCQQLERCLLVQGREQGQHRVLSINLDRLVEAHMVARGEGSLKRFSVVLMGQDDANLLTLTGPQAGAGHASDVWQLLMEALLPQPRRHPQCRAA
jgi:hypothetical protein